MTGKAMKKVEFKKRNNPKKGIKRLSIIQKTNDRECSTTVQKSFLYHVVKAEKEEANVEAPEIYIRKTFDTKKGIERFDFKVKGHFYMTHNRWFLKVNFHHKLNINIVWKKNFSPKKSAVLTK